MLNLSGLKMEDQMGLYELDVSALHRSIDALLNCILRSRFI